MTGPPSNTQSANALILLNKQKIVRLSEFRRAGITAATISRLRSQGKISQLARGLYQLPDSAVSLHHTLAEAAKLVPKGVVCLTSALAYHGLTDHIPARIWLAIGPKNWRSRISYPPLRFAHFPTERLQHDVEQHVVEGVSVRIFSIPRTLADLFRYRRTIGLDIAVEGLREALRQRKAAPAQIARKAEEAGVWRLMEPYLSALSRG